MDEKRIMNFKRNECGKENESANSHCCHPRDKKRRHTDAESQGEALSALTLGDFCNPILEISASSPCRCQFQQALLGVSLISFSQTIDNHLSIVFFSSNNCEAEENCTIKWQSFGSMLKAGLV